MPECPRVRDIKRRPNPKALPGTGKPCIVCGEFTTGQVWVQVSLFRGDDEVAHACKEHIKKSALLTKTYIERGEA